MLAALAAVRIGANFHVDDGDDDIWVMSQGVRKDNIQRNILKIC